MSWSQEESIALVNIRLMNNDQFDGSFYVASAWVEVARLLNLEKEMTRLGGPPRTGKDCSEKFKELKSYYRRRVPREDGKPYLDGAMDRFFKATGGKIKEVHANKDQLMPPISADDDEEELALVDAPLELTAPLQIEAAPSPLPSPWAETELHALLQLYALRKELGPDLWSAIAAQLRRMKFVRTREECKTKFERLHERYLNLRRIVEKGKKEPQSWPLYPAFEAMSLINDSCLDLNY